MLSQKNLFRSGLSTRLTVLNSCHLIVVTAVEDGVGLHGTDTVDEIIYPMRFTGQCAPSSANAIATALPITASAALTRAIFCKSVNHVNAQTPRLVHRPVFYLLAMLHAAVPADPLGIFGHGSTLARSWVLRFTARIGLSSVRRQPQTVRTAELPLRVTNPLYQHHPRTSERWSKADVLGHKVWNQGYIGPFQADRATGISCHFRKSETYTKRVGLARETCHEHTGLAGGTGVCSIFMCGRNRRLRRGSSRLRPHPIAGIDGPGSYRDPGCWVCHQRGT